MLLYKTILMLVNNISILLQLGFIIIIIVVVVVAVAVVV